MRSEQPFLCKGRASGRSGLAALRYGFCRPRAEDAAASGWKIVKGMHQDGKNE